MTTALIVATALVALGCLAGAASCLSAQRGLSLRAESRRPVLDLGGLAGKVKASDYEETTDEL